MKHRIRPFAARSCLFAPTAPAAACSEHSVAQKGQQRTRPDRRARAADGGQL